MTYEDNSVVHTYQAIAKGVIQSPTGRWICHNSADPVVLLVTNFSLIPSASVSLEQT